MIVPMKKVSLIMLSEQKADALKKLRRLGLVEIEITEGSGDRILQLREQIASLERCLFFLGKPDKGDVTKKALSPPEALAIARDVTALNEERQACQTERTALQAELARLQPYTRSRVVSFRECAEKGIDLSLYEIPASEYAHLDERVRTLTLERTKSSVKCLIVRSGAEGEEDAIASLHAYRVPLPAVSTGDIRQKIAQLDGRMTAIGEKIAGYAHDIGGIQQAMCTPEEGAGVRHLRHRYGGGGAVHRGRARGFRLLFPGVSGGGKPRPAEEGGPGQRLGPAGGRPQRRRTMFQPS